MDVIRESPLRGVTLDKLGRDVSNIRQYARFVIVLGGHQLEVIDNGHLRKEGLPYAKLIAVLGPTEYKGVSLRESVLMEVGYSKTRPYAQLEKRPIGDEREYSSRRWFLKERPRSRELSSDEFVSVYPHITCCMEKIVLEQRESWKTKEPWWRKGSGTGQATDRGIHFTISHSDELLHRKFILEDVRYRKWKYISRHASWIRQSFSGYKCSSYTTKQLKSFDKMCRIAEMLSQGHYTPFYRVVLANCFADGSRPRFLLDSVMEAFEIDVSLTEQEAIGLEPLPVALPKLKNLWCYRPPGQPLVQAKGSSVFELILERSYREKVETPF